MQAWDDRVFPRWAWPVRALIHMFSTVSLAVVLLSGVSIYAIFASVPIGILALAPTWGVYGLTLLASIAILGVLPAWLLGGAIIKAPGARFAFRVLVGLGLSVVATWAWGQIVWPALHYDPATGSGLRLFAGFIDQYDSVTLRRLPGIEMTELEFYSAWPMQMLLGLFVLNMIVATIRRIEFNFKNIGVLTVHTGIVVIALGSLYYQTQKLEGDTLLIAGQSDSSGVNSPGVAQRAFYDNVRVALWIDQLEGVGWEQRRLDGVPRYNEYGLAAGRAQPTESELKDAIFASGYRRSLSIDVAPARDPESTSIDPRLRFKVIGYAPYASQVEDWVRAEPEARTTAEPNPLRTVELYFDDPNTETSSGSDTESGESVEDEPAMTFSLTPTRPATRVSSTSVIAIEYTLGLSDQRFDDLATELPHAVGHGLVVRIPELGHEQVVVGEIGQRVELAETGWAVELEQLLPQPPFPIITAGYEGALSSVAVVRVIPPDTDPYTRWVYTRFPEISQDLLDEFHPDGRPIRRDADPAIEIVSVDSDRLLIHLDEDPSSGAVRAIIREPGGSPRIVEGIEPGERLDNIIERIHLGLGERWEHAERMSFPEPVAPSERDDDVIGTHDRAMLAIEVTMDGFPEWRETVWLPFIKFLSLTGALEESARSITPPTGRPISLAFGRLQWRFPDFQLRMLDFEMIAYDHRGAPRDYQALVGVEPTGEGRSFEPYRHVTRLNAPLKAPFLWSDDRSFVANLFGELASHLRPDQFKLSQAGWDADGWRESQQLADQGLIPRPRARFTILQVGNNPGIHVIAFGGVLMSLGIPWAFYLKPWLVRRERDAIKRQLQQSTTEGKTKGPTESLIPEELKPNPVPSAQATSQPTSQQGNT